MKCQHRRWKVAGVRKFKVHRFLYFRLRYQPTPNHLVQHLLLTLSLLGILARTVSKAGDVLLHGFDLILLPVVLFHLILFQLRFGFDELIIVTIVIL